jgi:hypothetical protein
MKKLDNKSVKLIKDVVNVAHLTGIEVLKISEDRISGHDENRTITILQPGDYSFLPHQIVIPRVDSLVSRLSLIPEDNMDITYNDRIDQKDQVSFISSLQMKGNNITVNYQCQSPSLAKTLKKIGDTLTTEITFGKDLVSLVSRAQQAMQAENVIVYVEDDKVGVKMLDIGGDEFEHTFSSTVKELDTSSRRASRNFYHRYSIKTFLTLLKHCDKNVMQVSEKGVLCLSIKQFNLYMLPQI